jgi:hypothetical protein
MADAGFGQVFDADASLKGWVAEYDKRKARAAQHAELALRARIPVGSGKKPGGHMRDSVSFELRPNGFVLMVNRYYAWWVEEGHKAGSRRTGRAKVLRSIAKELRRVRKETGDETSKAQEKAIRKEAASLDKQQKVSRSFVEGRKFVEKTLAAEKDAIIAILAGQA